MEIQPNYMTHPHLITLFLQRHTVGKVTCKLNGEELTAEESLKLMNHSPDGFEWGYNGSGPAQLALAICLKLWPELALRVYQTFKFKYIGKLSRNEDVLTVNINIADFEETLEAARNDVEIWKKVDEDIKQGFNDNDQLPF